MIYEAYTSYIFSLLTAHTVKRKEKITQKIVKNCNWITTVYVCSYGLLGASGCGKTTILSTIVGLTKLDQGLISVFGGSPGDRSIGIPGKRIGYMPQVHTFN